MISTPHNSLLKGKAKIGSIAVDTESLCCKTVFNLDSNTSKRKVERIRLFRKETAGEAITAFSREIDVFGFTKGQFSLIELLESVLDKTGPGHLTVSTWTAAKADMNDVLDFLNNGKILSVRFLIDFTFQRRQPEIAKRIRDVFGKESLRVTRNHAKFFLVKSEGWTVSCKTSMNLNKNPRFEDFDLSNNPDLYDFLHNIVSELFFQTSIVKQERMTIPELCKEFNPNG